MSKYYIYNGRLYSKDELEHFKYVSKEKKNGKWVYYYYHKTGNNTGSTYSSDKMSEYGYGTFTRSGGTSGLEDVTVERRKTNDLFSSRSTITYSVNSEKGKKYVTENVGLLEQNFNYVQNKVTKFTSKAKSWLTGLFGGK